MAVMDRRSGLTRDIMAYPTAGLASLPSEQKYRFNWNAPLINSPHDVSTMYYGGNILFKTTNGIMDKLFAPKYNSVRPYFC